MEFHRRSARRRVRPFPIISVSNTLSVGQCSHVDFALTLKLIRYKHERATSTFPVVLVPGFLE